MSAGPQNINSDGDQLPANLKCILVGDSGVGKTSLVVSYTTNDYPHFHNPSALDTFCVEVVADNRPVHLQIYDVGGGTEATSLRQYAYPGIHVVLLCFSVIKPPSFRALRTKWLRELGAAPILLNPVAAELLRTQSNGLPHSKLIHVSEKSSVVGKRPSRVLKQPQSRKCVSSCPSTSVPGPAFLLVGCACDLRNDIGHLVELAKQGDEPVNKETAEQLAAELGAEAYVECSALTQKNLKTVFDLAIWCGLKVAELGGPSNYFLTNHSSPNATFNDSANSTINRQTSIIRSAKSSNKDRPLWRKCLCFS